MTVSVERKQFQANLTFVGAGAVGAFAGDRVARKIIDSPLTDVATDVAGARIGGRMRHIGPWLAGAMGSFAARSNGASDGAAALAAHASGRVSTALPAVEENLGRLAETADSAVVRSAAGVGEFALREAPSAAGAVIGAKVTSGAARGAIRIAAVVGGAALIGFAATSLLPSVTWSAGSGD